jgi:hypothetical protein
VLVLRQEKKKLLYILLKKKKKVSTLDYSNVVCVLFFYFQLCFLGDLRILISIEDVS